MGDYMVGIDNMRYRVNLDNRVYRAGNSILRYLCNRM